MNLSPKYTLATRLTQFEKDMKGIFTTADLSNMVNAPNQLGNQRIIEQIVEAKIVQRVKRGLYVTQNFDPLCLAMRLEPQSYISMDTVLIRSGLIGTLNPSFISCIFSKPRAKSYSTDKITFEYHSVEDGLYFGFTEKDGGVRWADNEKAYLDLLYFYTKGKKFSFDPKSDIRLDKLDVNRVKKYLKQYKNPKFRTFVESLIYE